ncbi:NAD(P)/FAD-dependent oxidoreductase [Algisphaera agarilytica]|uniref:Flavin-dependent dehydrogenase n=1 Tax=Algisphaera agarilytica TaxID=1385975 RepID=A0A7X0LL40_9BACT|nr:NAD(P)/FAD-dependent oxidoreductase [Algisphaera agarilytica]MBB6430607.1 flavin-dependent dehydrogenase [Algisphaera agarilytica]
MEDTQRPEYDVVVIGGSIAGAATALQLLRGSRGCGCGMGDGCGCAELDKPLRVLVIERQVEFGRRVGESTVELSTYMLTRILGLTRHLNENHIVKQGFRYWFTNPDARDMGKSTEMGGRYLTRVGSFQVDRAELDKEVLRRVEALGGEIWKPANVRSLTLEEGGTQTLTVKVGDEERTVTSRWVVDASGRQAMIARQRGEVEPIKGHPSAAVWARWKNTLDFDSPDTIARFPELGKGMFGTRHTATNHIMGDGWWAWVIPLKNGHTSVGVTWDQRIFKWPRTQGSTLAEQLRSVLETHPVGRALLEDAELIESDVHVRRNLPYQCKTAAGDGFLLVGDAAGFVDPFYSMGLDFLSMTSTSGVDMILTERRGDCIKAKLARHNDMVGKSIPRWFEAIFRDKYFYMGDFELMRIAFLVDIGLYYLGIVRPPYKNGKMAIKDGMFYAKAAKPFYLYMRFVNHRLAALGAERRKRGTFGRRNAGQRMLVPGFAFDSSIVKATARAMIYLLKLELSEGWRCWRPKRGADGSIVLRDKDKPDEMKTPTSLQTAG